MTLPTPETRPPFRRVTMRPDSGKALPEFTHPAWVKAAVEEPLIEDGSARKRIIFDPEGFCRRLREYADADGGYEQAPSCDLKASSQGFSCPAEFDPRC